jgi:hypothetical protein
MPAPQRFPWIYRIGVLALILVSVAALALIVWGAYGLIQQRTVAAMEILIGGAFLGFAGFYYGLLMLLLKVESASYRIHTLLFDMHELLTKFKGPVDTVAENIQISDIAKSIAHREKERETLRTAIREDIVKADWEAAYYLIDEMERRFGYREEAERLRQEVDDSRQLSIAEKIDQAIGHVEQILGRHEWERAGQEAERLARLFPNNDKVRHLPAHIEERKQQRKRELLKEWDADVRRNDIDQAIETLKALDPYLTQNEAKALEESVRGVLKAKLAQLGVKFSLAVSEKRWADALEVGLQISEEFPNSKMAKEVGDSMEVLKHRAGMVPDAELIEQRPPSQPAS